MAKITEARLKRLYNRLNRIYFNNSLPRNVVIKIVKKVDSKDTAVAETSEWTDENGALVNYKITFLDKMLKLSPRYTGIVMRHEMCHLAAGLHNNHNKVFQNNIRRLFKLGAYDEIL